MLPPIIFPLTTLTLLCLLFSLVVAHGDEHDASAITMNTQDQDSPRSYWSLSDYATLMYWHIGLEVFAWMFVLPISRYLLFCCVELH